MLAGALNIISCQLLDSTIKLRTVHVPMHRDEMDKSGVQGVPGTETLILRNNAKKRATHGRFMNHSKKDG